MDHFPHMYLLIYRLEFLFVSDFKITLQQDKKFIAMGIIMTFGRFPE